MYLFELIDGCWLWVVGGGFKLLFVEKNCVPRCGGLHYLSLEVLCIEEGVIVGELDQLVHLFSGFVNNGQMQIPGGKREKLLLKKIVHFLKL